MGLNPILYAYVDGKYAGTISGWIFKEDAEEQAARRWPGKPALLSLTPPDCSLEPLPFQPPRAPMPVPDDYRVYLLRTPQSDQLLKARHEINEKIFAREIAALGLEMIEEPSCGDVALYVSLSTAVGLIGFLKLLKPLLMGADNLFVAVPRRELNEWKSRKELSKFSFGWRI